MVIGRCCLFDWMNNYGIRRLGEQYGARVSKQLRIPHALGKRDLPALGYFADQNGIHIFILYESDCMSNYFTVSIHPLPARRLREPCEAIQKHVTEL